MTKPQRRFLSSITLALVAIGSRHEQEAVLPDQQA